MAPSHICMIGLGIGCALLFVPSYVRLAKRIVVGAFSAILLLGFSPLGTALILPLEERFKIPNKLPEDGEIAGLIMLGGFEDGDISAARRQFSVNERGERLLEALRLAHKLPSAKLIFTGGAAGIFLEHRDAGSASKATCAMSE